MLPQVLDTWFQFRFPAAHMVKGKLMGGEKTEDGGEKPNIDLEKEIPTPFPGVAIKVALEATVAFPYQFMAGGAVNFTVYVKLNNLFAELRIVNKEPKIAHASGVCSDASGPEGRGGSCLAQTAHLFGPVLGTARILTRGCKRRGRCEFFQPGPADFMVDPATESCFAQYRKEECAPFPTQTHEVGPKSM